MKSRRNIVSLKANHCIRINLDNRRGSSLSASTNWPHELSLTRGTAQVAGIGWCVYILPWRVREHTFSAFACFVSTRVFLLEAVKEAL